MLQVPPNRAGGAAAIRTFDELPDLDANRYEDGSMSMDMEEHLRQQFIKTAGIRTFDDLPDLDESQVEYGNPPVDMQQQGPHMFPVLMPQNIQGQVMGPLVQVSMPYNTPDQQGAPWMAPMQGGQNVPIQFQRQMSGPENVPLQFQRQISTQSQMSQHSIDQGNHLTFGLPDHGQPQQQPGLQQLLLVASPTHSQHPQQMPPDQVDEMMQMQRHRQQQQMLQNSARQQQNGRRQQQQQTPQSSFRPQKMQAPPQQAILMPQQGMDTQPPGTWHRDQEPWLRPPRQMGGSNWRREEQPQDWQQLRGGAMPGQNGSTEFPVDNMPPSWPYTGNEVVHRPPHAPPAEGPRSGERMPATKMNWAELSEGTGDPFMQRQLDFQGSGPRGYPKPAGNQQMQQMQQVRRGMDKGGSSVHNKMKPSGRGGAGRTNPVGSIDGLSFPAEMMAGTGEAPMYGQSRDMWDSAGPMMNRGRGQQADSMSGGRHAGNTADRRRAPWGGDAPAPDARSLPGSNRNGGSPTANVAGTGRPSPWNPGAADTMKAQLQALQLEDPTTVFIARRINKLGFTSAEQLEAHFSKYGEVKGVYVSHSRVKSLRAPGDRNMHNAHWRLRAAALGFVVMKSPEVTSKILSEGSEHNVNGVTVRLQSFHRRNCADAAPGEEINGPQEESAMPDSPNWQSHVSDEPLEDYMGSPVHSQASPPQSMNKMPINQVPKAMEDPNMMDAAQLYHNFVISGGPIIYGSPDEQYHD